MIKPRDGMLTQSEIHRFKKSHGVGTMLTIQIAEVTELESGKVMKKNHNVKVEVLAVFPFVCRTTKGDFTWSDLYIRQKRASGEYDEQGIRKNRETKWEKVVNG